MYLRKLYFWYHSGLYSMQERSYLDKFAIVSIWFRMGLTQISTQEYKDFHLDIPTKYQYLTGCTILRPTGRFFDTIINLDYCYHAFTYMPYLGVHHAMWSFAHGRRNLQHVGWQRLEFGGYKILLFLNTWTHWWSISLCASRTPELYNCIM